MLHSHTFTTSDLLISQFCIPYQIMVHGKQTTFFSAVCHLIAVKPNILSIKFARIVCHTNWMKADF